MTLTDAIKSGNPFKLPGQYWLQACQGKIVEEASGRTVTIHSPTDLISNEWITKSPEVTFNEEQILKIFANIKKKFEGKSLTPDSLFTIICEELGLRKERDTYEKDST